MLAGYKKILSALRVDAGLELPGVYELGRSNPAKDSPICWSDAGDLQVVRTVPGGPVDPGKVVAGLARAAEPAGAQILEHTEVHVIEYSNPLRLRVGHKVRGRFQQKEVRAAQILLATNAFSLELSDLRGATQPKLTLALATAPSIKLARPEPVPAGCWRLPVSVLSKLNVPSRRRKNHSPLTSSAGRSESMTAGSPSAGYMSTNARQLPTWSLRGRSNPSMTARTKCRYETTG